MLNGATRNLYTLAKVVSYSAKPSARWAQIRAWVQSPPARCAAGDAELARDAAMLQPATALQGLSLGARYGLALARRKYLPAMTPERRWSEDREAVGVDIRRIR